MCRDGVDGSNDADKHHDPSKATRAEEKQDGVVLRWRTDVAVLFLTLSLSAP